MNLLKPDWLCCHISPQPTPLLTLRVLPPALHSQCCAAALLLLQLRVQTQEKTFVVLVVFCNAGMAQSSSSKCWGHYEESRDAALLCDDSWSSLSRVSEMNWLWCGLTNQQGWGNEGAGWDWGVGKGLENQTFPPTVRKVQLGCSLSPDGSSPNCASKKPTPGLTLELLVFLFWALTVSKSHLLAEELEGGGSSAMWPSCCLEHCYLNRSCLDLGTLDFCGSKGSRCRQYANRLLTVYVQLCISTCAHIYIYNWINPWKFIIYKKSHCLGCPNSWVFLNCYISSVQTGRGKKRTV